MVQLNFDATKVAPAQAYEALPSDKYLVEITKSELKPMKAGNGSYLELEYTVLDGEYRGRKVWDRLCLIHPRAETVKIARSQLSAICHAVDVLHPQYSTELHNIPLKITVKVKRDKNSDNMFNEVTAYAMRESYVPRTPPPNAAAQVQTAQYPQAPVNDAVPPWQRSEGL